MPSKKLLLITGCLGITGSLAAQMETPVRTTSSQGNELVILIGFIAVILAFVIYGMGQVLVTLGRQVLDKEKKDGSAVFSMILLAGISLLSMNVQAQGQAVIETPKASHLYGGLGSTGFWVLVTVLFIETVVIAYLMFSIRRLQRELLPEKKRKKVLALSALWSNLDKKVFTKAVDVKDEAAVTLDHEYDGIRELDNSLPPWWKYGFIITIIVACGYLLNFHVLGYGKNPTQEYEAELLKAKEDKEAYDAMNKDKVDESNITMPAADGIAAGKEIFTSACWACHGKQGEGGAGPNLTDDYWLHKGSISDIYQSIKHGYPDKGMQSWEKTYTPKEINNLAGFIKTLRGTNPPNAKAAQGDLFTEPPAADSTIAVKDSATATLKLK